jgi:hypothetical protein
MTKGHPLDDLDDEIRDHIDRACATSPVLQAAALPAE